MTTGMIKGKHNMGKHLEEMMDGLTKLLNIGQVTDTRETSRRDDGWTNKVAKYRTSDRYKRNI